MRLQFAMTCPMTPFRIDIRSQMLIDLTVSIKTFMFPKSAKYIVSWQKSPTALDETIFDYYYLTFQIVLMVCHNNY